MTEIVENHVDGECNKETGGDKAGDEGVSCSLPSWMRYMPNPPWKNFSDLNLQLPHEEDIEDKKTYQENVYVEQGKETQETKANKKRNIETRGTADEITERPHNEKFSNASNNFSTEITKRKIKRKASSNPFSTSHIHFSSLVENADSQSHDAPKKSNTKRKRRRIYNENHSTNLEDTAALFSYCKFNK